MLSVSSVYATSDESKNMLVSDESISGILARLENSDVMVFTEYCCAENAVNSKRQQISDLSIP